MAQARRANPQRGPVAAGMAAVRALAHAAAQEQREHGIHVGLVIVDGIIESPKTARMAAGMPAEALVRQEDVVRAVSFLASQSARGLTHSCRHTGGRPLASLTQPRSVRSSSRQPLPAANAETSGLRGLAVGDQAVGMAEAQPVGGVADQPRRHAPAAVCVGDVERIELAPAREPRECAAVRQVCREVGEPDQLVHRATR